MIIGRRHAGTRATPGGSAMTGGEVNLNHTDGSVICGIPANNVYMRWACRHAKHDRRLGGNDGNYWKYLSPVNHKTLEFRYTFALDQNKKSE